MSQLKRAELLYQGAQPSLRSWLDLSWFYPLEFSKEDLIETPRSFLVIGEREVVKFRKPGLGAARHFLPFAERWRSAVREILANAEVAPGVYQGLRTFRYQDDELIWCEDVPRTDFSLDEVPEADEVAVSLARLPSEEFLNAALRADVADEDRLSALAERLLWFYRTRKKSDASFVHEQFVASLFDNMRETIRVLKEEDTFGEAWERVVLAELRSWLERALERAERALFARAERGCVREAHGALYAEHICVPLDSLNPVILGRSPAQLLGFKKDVLSDLATLYVDLSVLGCASSAELLLSLLQELEPQYFAAEREIVDLFCVHAALEEVLRRPWSDGDALLSAKRSTYLQFAYRTALGITAGGAGRSAILVFEGERQTGKGETAWLTAQLIGAEFIGYAADDLPAAGEGAEIFGTPEVFGASAANDRDERQLFFELATNALRTNKSVVLERRQCAREERLQLAELAEKFECELLWLRCRGPVEAKPADELSLTNLQAGLHWDEQIMQRPLNVMPLELALAPLASAKMVLHELRRIISRKTTSLAGQSAPF